MADATQLAAALRAQLAAAVQQRLAAYAMHLATVVQANPRGAIPGILARPDLVANLDQAMAAGRDAAQAAVRQSWQAAAGDTDSPVLASLLADVDRAYSQAPAQIRQAATAAWHSVEQREFVPGESVPGTNPAYETAVQRAQAVREAVEGQGAALALRGGLSVDVAASSGRTAAALADPRPDQAGKRWVASMDGKDPKSCAWCKALHGTVVPREDQFPHPSQIGKHKPPKVYRGELHGPPLHPQCRCRIELVSLGEAPPEPGPEAADLAEPQDMVSSEDIAAMPEERYQGLRHFLGSALHELAQVIKAILGIGAA